MGQLAARALLLAIVASVAGCVEAGLIECGDLLCPSGTVCTPAGCSDPAAAAACAGQTDGTECNVADTLGVCHLGTCMPPICGDGLKELAEACDDGNLIAGDGCSATCASDESCGNGIIDLSRDEACDDGVVGVSSDGCSSTCGAETADWDDISPQPIAARFGHGMAYDSVSDRTLLFGGETAQVWLGDTWEWNGTQWTHKTPLDSPSPRSDFGMVFDAARGEVVLFGGLGGNGIVGDTWTWDGATWTERHPALSPAPRSTHAMAYDARRGVVVMFGGGTDSGLVSETWEWNGTTWTLRDDVGSPPGRAWPSLAFDESRGVTVLYGLTQETWEYDGVIWTQKLVAPPTQLGYRSPLFYDEERLRVVLIGGYVPGGSTDQQWSWDGATWVQDTPATLPTARYGAAAVYGRERDEVVLFGGAASGPLAETWIWSSATWNPAGSAPVAPYPRDSGYMVFDPVHGRSLLFSGTGDGFIEDELWEWDGAAWIERKEIPRPPGRYRFSTAYDRARGRLVVFGGVGAGSTYLNDTWEWDDEQWVHLTPATSPSPRGSPTMAYDEDHHEVVMFGGFGSPSFGPETWIWDGVDWTQKSPAVQPPPTSQGYMVYDSVARKIEMVITDLAPAQVWEWDGSTWTQRPAAASLPLRYWPNVAFDAQRGRLVVHAGVGGGAHRNDTWEYDGATWTELDTPNRPMPRTWSTMVYDTIRRELVMFGGNGLAMNEYGDTWALRFGAPFERLERCALAVDEDGDGLAGCDDPDCWGRCAPMCPPGRTCPPDAIRCGDGACSLVEDHALCPADCP